MAINVYNIKKWYKMMTGKSIMHVNQNLGKSFSTTEIKGYYNDLTEKVTKDTAILYTNELPLHQIETGRKIFFPIQIFQYGLGAYDLYLQTKDTLYLDKFVACVEWARNNQGENGSWDNFSFIYPDSPFSSMCQGEGASLLLRSAIEFKHEDDAQAAKKAIDFMLTPLDQGGTAKDVDGNLVLLEYTNRDLVLNGWIFSAFGLYDMALYDKEHYEEAWLDTIKSIKAMLPQFDNGQWTFYELDKKISSPFYHNLHIAQMEALYHITEDNIFLEYAEKWRKYQKSKIYRSKAFIKKAVQKIME